MHVMKHTKSKGFLVNYRAGKEWDSDNISMFKLTVKTHCIAQLSISSSAIMESMPFSQSSLKAESKTIKIIATESPNGQYQYRKWKMRNENFKMKQRSKISAITIIFTLYFLIQFHICLIITILPSFQNCLL